MILQESEAHQPDGTAPGSFEGKAGSEDLNLKNEVGNRLCLSLRYNTHRQTFPGNLSALWHFMSNFRLVFTRFCHNDQNV